MSIASASITTETQDSTELQLRLTDMVESMPAFPQSVHQIIAMTSDINCSPKDLVRLIEHDPVMTMKILKLVNSAFFALSRNVSSVQHAMVYLGMNTIKNLAVSIATLSTLPRQCIPELEMNAFLSHSLATASVAQFLAKEKLKIKDASDFFVAGLLHDFGKAVLAQFEAAAYQKTLQTALEQQVPLTEVEQRTFGTTSAEVGALLAESWQFPESLVSCIREHIHYTEDSSDLTIAVAAAKAIVQTMKIGNNGDPCIPVFSGILKSRLDCEPEDIIKQMRNLDADVASLLVSVGGA